MPAPRCERQPRNAQTLGPCPEQLSCKLKMKNDNHQLLCMVCYPGQGNINRIAFDLHCVPAVKLCKGYCMLSSGAQHICAAC